MHILYWHYLCLGATGLHHVEQLVAGVRTLGHTIDVHAMNLAPGPATPSAPATPRSPTRQLLKKKLRRYLHEPKELLWNIPYYRKGIQILRSSTADVLLVRDHLLTASCVAVARRLKIPLTLELNAPASESRLYFDEYAHLPFLPEWLEAWKVRRADTVTVVSSALKQYVMANYGVEEDKIVVNPNGADCLRFRPDLPSGGELPHSFKRGVVVGFIGSFQKFHGSEILARMALSVADLRPAVRFVFVGDGPEAGTLRQMTEELGDRVLFTGRVSHARVPGIVADLDVAVMPESNFYGSPLKVIEWMAAGRAVVAPAYEPIEEIIDSGREGLLFPPGDEAALVDSVLELVDNPRRRDALGKRAAARAVASLTWEDNARRLIGACEKALANCRSAQDRSRR